MTVMVELKFIFTDEIKKWVVDDLDKPNQSHHEPRAWNVYKEKQMVHLDRNKATHEIME